MASHTIKPSRSLAVFVLGLLANDVLVVSANPANVDTGFSVPARRVRSLQRRDGASVASTNHVVVDFTFGGQRIPLSLDSGSTFTYVASTLDMDQTETSVLPTLFNPNASSTYHDENDPEDAFNCGGDITTCVLGVDNVSAGGLTAMQMVFGVASHVAQGVFESGQAGTLGFGRQADDPADWLPRDQTFWYRTGANLHEPYLFTVDLYEDRNGTFDFGYIDTSKYSGDITYAKVDSSVTNWNFNMTGFAISNGSMQTATEFAGIVDTGGPNIGLPAPIVKAYFATFGGTPAPGNSHDYPCAAYPPPDLTLQIKGGGTLVLNGSFLVEPPDGSGAEMCSGRLDDSEQSAYNLGASVLDQKFVVFDHAKQRIGFANKASAGGNSTGSGSGSDGSSTSTGNAQMSTTAMQATSAPTPVSSSHPTSATGSHATTTSTGGGAALVSGRRSILSSLAALMLAWFM